MKIQWQIISLLYLFYFFSKEACDGFQFSELFSLALLTTYETSWRVTTSNRTAVPSNTHTFLINEVPKTQIGLTGINILAGGSLLIVFLLFAIVRELYTCKSKKSPKNAREQNKAYDVSVDIVQEKTNKCLQKKNITDSIQCGETQYFTIDNGLEIRHSRITLRRQRTTRDIFTGLLTCISGMRRTKTFVEV